MEAILVVRAQPGISDGDRDEMFLIPVDACYSLAGALRLNWHGFDGGAEVRTIWRRSSPTCGGALAHDSEAVRRWRN